MVAFQAPQRGSTARLGSRRLVSTDPSPAVISEGGSIQFTGSVSGKPPASYSWSFSGGNPSSSGQQTVTVSYATAGSFQETLQGANDKGQTCQSSVSVTVIPAGGGGNTPPTANANGPYTGTAGAPVSFSSAGSNDPDGSISSYAWDFGDGGSSSAANPSHSYAAAGSYSVSLTVADNNGASDSDSTTATISAVSACPEGWDPSAVPALSINSTSQNSECQNSNVVAEQAKMPNTSYSVLAINDLGMHCGDYDTRVASILPPFQVLLAQVIQKGSSPTLNPAGVNVFYSAASNPADPTPDVFDGVMVDGSSYKTNFWDTVALGAYNPFYPSDIDGSMSPDLGLPVPNLEDYYIGGDGVVDNGDESLNAPHHAMPGMTNPYVANQPQQAKEHYADKPFFIGFPFGYVADGVDWYEAAGVPFSAFDDFGRENPYPLVRVQAKSGSSVLSTVDTVLPISGEASCTNCHTTNADYTSVRGEANRTDIPTEALTNATPSIPVATSLDDPDSNMPAKVSLEYAADINILRLHDLRHGAEYVTPSGDGVASAAPCDIHDTTDGPGMGDANCLTNKALMQGKPVVCQVCHYTPALDLLHAGPLTGPAGTTDANGRNQLAHQSNSRVMHNHHGTITALDRNGDPMFPAISAPTQTASGAITNQTTRLGQLEDSCYQCHPGKTTQCLRGAMFNADMLCSDCHGSMQQVGNDFSKDVSPSAPGNFILSAGNFYNASSSQPRVPWANEPGCGSCHTGDAGSNLAGTTGTLVNLTDTNGNSDGIRLRQAYRTGDVKATPIVPGNKRFAEPAVPASFNGFANPGAGNPKLYRVSTGHGGVMCEGCHGATHAEWPNANPDANDNLTAEQLQGHSGTIVECSTCHGSAMDSQNTLGGPHGMHPVGANTSFANGGHERVDRSGCADCHGPGGRSSNAGTVLSLAKADRTLRGTLVRKGEPVGCSTCHGSGGGD